MAVGANHPRTIARPQYGPASACRRTNGPSENPRRRGCRLPRHDGGRPAYSRSGLSHLLAVSGLHTGIVFALVNLLLWWLPLLRRGHLLRNLLAAACIWIYVAAAGFPPSAVRTAVMFTMLQSALASASEYNGLNALAAAAFGMLLWLSLIHI